MPLSREQLVAAFGLVDEMIDCRAQLEGDPEGRRRAALEGVLADRATRLQFYVDTASEVLISPEARSERFAVESQVINQASESDLVLFAHVALTPHLIFGWRTSGGRIGPDFDDRDLAIDWMSERLAKDDG